ncbi:MAG: hypothetical protein ACT4PT_08105 [Methanobacteriota archaeon]
MPNPKVDRLFTDAVGMSINKNIVDIATLLTWATETADLAEKKGHVERAIELLEDVKKNLEMLQRGERPPP